MFSHVAQMLDANIPCHDLIIWNQPSIEREREQYTDDRILSQNYIYLAHQLNLDTRCQNFERDKIPQSSSEIYCNLITTIPSLDSLTYLSGWRDKVFLSLLLGRRGGATLRRMAALLTTFLLLPLASLLAPVR